MFSLGVRPARELENEAIQHYSSPFSLGHVCMHVASNVTRLLPLVGTLYFLFL